MRSYSAIIRIGTRNLFTRAGLLVPMFVVILAAASSLSAAAQSLLFSDDFEDGVLLDDWDSGNASWFLATGEACEGSSDGPLVSLQTFTFPVSGSVEITRSALAQNGGFVAFSPKAAVSPGLELQVGYLALVLNSGGDIFGQILQIQLAPSEELIRVEDTFELSEIPTRLGLNVNDENLEFVADGGVLQTVSRVALPLIGDTGAIAFGAGGGLPATTCFDNVVLTTLLAPELQVERLIEDINDEGLAPGIADTLIAPLKAAFELLTDGIPRNDIAACRLLDAFIREVNTLETSGDLTAEQAARFRSSAETTKASLDCP